MKKMFNKAAIMGMGLMGGSLGLALKEKNLASTVTGWGRNENRLNLARRLGAADNITTDMEKAVKDADIVVICLPVNMITDCFKRIKPFVKKGAVVTDMGSIKEKIVTEIDDPCFVGAHPMAGSEKTGTENIKSGLYKNATCIITPCKKNKKADIKKVSEMFKAIGMKIFLMTPAVHDKAVAGISHMPHAAAYALALSQKRIIKNCPQIIGPGFKDTTRIAASTEEIWAGIMFGNRKNILEEINAYQKELENFKKAVNSGEKELKAYIKKARIIRELLDK